MDYEIYLDHAATSYPKPPSVLEAMQEWAEGLGASAGRGDYPRAVITGEMIRHCRAALARLLGAPDLERVIFTLNCTDALNMALRGAGLRSGDRVVVGPTEHNSVMRPLNAMVRTAGIEVVRLPGRPDGSILIADLESALTTPTRLVVIQHASNVLGTLHDLEAIGRICRAAGVRLLVDAAQTAGCYPLDMSALGIDMLAVPGHKGLQGPLGTGALLLGSGVEVDPWRMGGTGSRSEEEEQPDEYPDRLESGSHNAPGIVGLLAAAEWILDRGVDSLRHHEEHLLQLFLAGLEPLESADKIRVLGSRDAARKSPVVALSIRNAAPSLVAARLWEEHKIMVRPGLHCAPAAHKLAGSYPAGALRFSFGPYTSDTDIDSALRGLAGVLA